MKKYFSVPDCFTLCILFNKGYKIIKSFFPYGLRRTKGSASLLVIISLTVLLTGCTQTIPSQANLQLDIPQDQKRDDALTIRMSEELRSLEIVVKPLDIPLTNSFKFQIGKSLEGNLSSALQGLFITTPVSSLPIDDITSTPFILEADLVSYDFEIGISIFSTHTAEMVIRYSFYQERRKMFTFETKTNGSSSMSSGETWGHVLIPGESAYASGYRGSIARAYDEALAKSVNQLVDKIQETF